MNTVDVAAPGVGIRSTEPGGRFGTRNGTSMAAPQVAGVAALLWSRLPDAGVDEIKTALLQGASQFSTPTGKLVRDGIVNARDAFSQPVFAPSARVISKQDITSTGGTSTRITVEFQHRNGINASFEGPAIRVERNHDATQEIDIQRVPGSVSVGIDCRSRTISLHQGVPGIAWTSETIGSSQWLDRCDRIPAS